MNKSGYQGSADNYHCGLTKIPPFYLCSDSGRPMQIYHNPPEKQIMPPFSYEKRKEIADLIRAQFYRR